MAVAGPKPQPKFCSWKSVFTSQAQSILSITHFLKVSHLSLSLGLPVRGPSEAINKYLGFIFLIAKKT